MSRGGFHTLKSPWLRLAMFAGAVGLFLLGYYWGNQHKTPSELEVSAAIVIRPPLPLAEFHAVDPAGHTFELPRFKGHWSLLIVGDPDDVLVKPTLALLSRVYNRLAEFPDLQKDTRRVLISTAPTTDVFRQSGLVQAYAPADQLTELMSQTATGGAPANLHLIDPQARIVALFTPDRRPATIAADIHSIIATNP